MKANEMPEKIYIFDYNDAMVTPIKGDTVYVREDAFIEKAVVWISNNCYIPHSTLENFRKYMKGE